jgi:hypothetical protein
MKAVTRSPKIRRLVEHARRIGYTVEFVPFCEDAETPGMLGRIGGVCVRERKAIKVRTTGMTREHIAAILSHELEHAEGAERGTDHPALGLKCGGDLNAWAKA